MELASLDFIQEHWLTLAVVYLLGAYTGQWLIGKALGLLNKASPKPPA